MGGGKCYKTVNKYLKKNVSTKSVFDMEQIQSENNEYPSSIYYNSMRCLDEDISILMFNHIIHRPLLVVERCVLFWLTTYSESACFEILQE